MNSPKILRRRPGLVSLMALLAVLGASIARAQQQSGNLHGSVRSDGGDPLPGVTVELSGLGATLVQLADAQGDFRFLALAPGRYRLTANLDGFSPVVHEAVTIAVGRNTAVEVTLSGAIEEAINVSAESPLLDERKITVGATVSSVELDKIPTARDPWVILQSVPGVLTTAVNVGGNKSGMQQAFTGTGAMSWDNTYAIDGAVINDVASGNSSYTYYDFGALEEVQVTTGGTDATKMGGGVTLNLVTKRGTNQWRATARYLVADEGWQSDLDPDPRVLGEGQEQFTQGDRIVKIEEAGIEGGGPLRRDRLWGWAFVSQNDIDRLTIDDVRDFTQLEHYGGKLNAQLGQHNSATVLYQHSRKLVDGRGAGPSRPEPATWYQDGESSILKLDDTHMFGSRLFATALVSKLTGPFSLTPKGGIDGPNAVLDEEFVWQNNFWWYETDRPQEQATLEGNLFFTTGEVSHELQLGAGFRSAESDDRLGWPGDVLRLDFYRSFGFPYNLAQVSRPVVWAYTTDFTHLFVQDTLRAGRWTVNLGLRYDLQEGRLDSGSVPGVAGFEALPDGTPLLPAVSFDGRDQQFDWEDVAPRLGVTWALGEQRETLLRMSYSRFVTQMDQWYQFLEWPISYSYAYFFYEDENGDGRVTVDEIVCFECGPLGTNGYDPLAREGLFDIDPSFDGAINDELILAVEHSLLPELVVGLSATWRNQHGIEEYERLVEEGGVVRPHRRSDYELFDVHTVALPDGSTSDVEVWGLRAGVIDTGRTYLTNGERETDYLGLNLTLHKRLSNRWMLRGHVSWSDWTWSVPEGEQEDPSRSRSNVDWVGSAGGADDGGPVFMDPITPGWSYRLGGLVQIAPDRPWGFDLAANLWGRQGYALAYRTLELSNFAGDGTVNLYAVRPLDAYRLPDVHVVDLRLDKSIALGEFEATIGVECFNALNASTVLRRNTRVDSARSNWAEEVVSPRIFRLNLRLSFH